jgi:proteasome lid subunit RPN8/RPN11
MINHLVLPKRLRAAILAAAREASPLECCGLIQGVVNGAMARALVLHRARNIAGPDRFQIDPENHFEALHRARQDGHGIIGCYHSHPGGRAEPSAADLAGASEVDFLWVIAAPAQDAVAAFVYTGGGFCGVPTGADWVTSSW